MAVLTTAHVKGEPKKVMTEFSIGLQELIRKAPGFILHTSYPYEEGWVVAEIWETKADADAFFAKYVVPNLQAGIHPKRSYQELHSIVTTS